MVRASMALPRVITDDPGVQPEQEPVAPPALADDVAALRTLVALYTPLTSQHRADMLAHLDRIAALAPQPAIQGRWPWYIHECGHAECFGEAPDHGGCDACESGSLNPADWRPLYTLGGAA
jgi:hypothetical protein